MKAQLDELARSAPSQRIELREPLLAHGAAVVGPLADLAAADPELGPSVTAWREVLAKRDEEAMAPVVTALRTLATRAPRKTPAVTRQRPSRASACRSPRALDARWPRRPDPRRPMGAAAFRPAGRAYSCAAAAARR